MDKPFDWKNYIAIDRSSFSSKEYAHVIDTMDLIASTNDGRKLIKHGYDMHNELYDAYHKSPPEQERRIKITAGEESLIYNGRGEIQINIERIYNRYTVGADKEKQEHALTYTMLHELFHMADPGLHYEGIHHQAALRAIKSNNLEDSDRRDVYKKALALVFEEKPNIARTLNPDKHMSTLRTMFDSSFKQEVARRSGVKDYSFDFESDKKMIKTIRREAEERAVDYTDAFTAKHFKDAPMRRDYSNMVVSRKPFDPPDLKNIPLPELVKEAVKDIPLAAQEYQPIEVMIDDKAYTSPSVPQGVQPEQMSVKQK